MVNRNSVADLIESRTEQGPGTCQTWRGPFVRGRAVVYLKGDQYSVLKWKLDLKKHGNSIRLDRLCNSPGCVNPDHYSKQDTRNETEAEGARQKVLSLLPAADENGCSIWGGTVNDRGNPVVYHKDRKYSVRRLLHTQMQNPVSVCGNKLCCSSEHATEKKNLAAGRISSRSCELLYGLPERSHEELLSNGCHICGGSSYLQIDHDHATGKVRGVLCSKHNAGLGKVGDTPQDLGNVIRYLKKNGIVLIDPMPPTHPYKHSRLYRRERSWIRRTFANQHIVDELHAQQQSKCACCGAAFEVKGGKRPNLDHEDLPDGSKRVRGLLCLNCNQGLGKLGDNLEGVERALAYLRGELNPRKDYTNGAILS